MVGYHDMPEQAAEAIDEDGWLRTGDLAAMDERGYCTVEGRLKDMIIRGGENIYPKELEEMLLAHPAVAEVAVVGLPDNKYGRGRRRIRPSCRRNDHRRLPRRLRHLTWRQRAFLALAHAPGGMTGNSPVSR